MSFPGQTCLKMFMDRGPFHRQVLKVVTASWIPREHTGRGLPRLSSSTAPAGASLAPKHIFETGCVSVTHM